MFSLLTLFAVVLIHVVIQMRRKDLAEAERKHNFPRVVITTLSTTEGDKGKGTGGGEMGWIDPAAAAATQAKEGDKAAKKKQKEEEEEWARYEKASF